MTANTTSWAVLDEAHEALRTVVRGVADGDWALPTPCSSWNVTQVLQHAAGDQTAFAAFITGGPGPTEDPFAPSGTLAADARGVAEEAMKAAADAWATVAADAENVSVPVPPGKLPAAVGAGACALDAAVHAWDIAAATGQPSPLTPGLARVLMDVAERIVEPLRAYGAYGPALETRDGDDDVAVLLRYLGRDPRWSAR
ncbi:TIGR03086 family metal-binding protein [Microtetraspora niveoalba]|uniref:TIGR03086 family metal-binding protein n=1 Tax=Microtetraspora niveoalba TaxID=46175 RepID=UPI000834B9B3|nr:TIGR03086 family metal-binding protein [Microtetraspora niveoalba]